MKKYLVHIVWLVIVIVALAGGFFWGKASATSNLRSAFTGAAGTYGSSTRRIAGAGGTTGGGLISGQILSLGTDSMTVQLANGNSQVVIYSSSTSVSKPTTVSLSTLVVGTNVMVTGTSNSDGSVTAQTIQVRPADTAGVAPTGGAASGQ
jgi:hypothetical protein